MGLAGCCIIEIEKENKSFRNRKKNQMLTAYQVAKNLNVVLKSKNLKEVPTQMLYNYVRNRLIPTTQTADGVRIRESDANAFIAKYVAKRTAKAQA
jgi:CRISPR/Cas system CSM-associated protein Csm2 small subunit